MTAWKATFYTIRWNYLTSELPRVSGSNNNILKVFTELSSSPILTVEFNMPSKGPTSELFHETQMQTLRGNGAEQVSHAYFVF